MLPSFVFWFFWLLLLGVDASTWMCILNFKTPGTRSACVTRGRCVSGQPALCSISAVTWVVIVRTPGLAALLPAQFKECLIHTFRGR